MPKKHAVAIGVVFLLFLASLMACNPGEGDAGIVDDALVHGAGHQPVEIAVEAAPGGALEGIDDHRRIAVGHRCGRDEPHAGRQRRRHVGTRGRGGG